MHPQDRSATPHCMRSFTVKRGKTIVPVSIVAAHEDLEHLAVGLYDGTVLLYSGMSHCVYFHSMLIMMQEISRGSVLAIDRPR